MHNPLLARLETRMHRQVNVRNKAFLPGCDVARRGHDHPSAVVGAVFELGCS